MFFGETCSHGSEWVIPVSNAMSFPDTSECDLPSPFLVIIFQFVSPLPSSIFSFPLDIRETPMVNWQWNGSSFRFLPVRHLVYSLANYHCDTVTQRPSPSSPYSRLTLFVYESFWLPVEYTLFHCWYFVKYCLTYLFCWCRSSLTLIYYSPIEFINVIIHHNNSIPDCSRWSRIIVSAQFQMFIMLPGCIIHLLLA